MKAGFGRRCAAVAMAGLLAGCGKFAGYYRVSPNAAWVALMGTTIPGMAFGEEAHGLPASGTPDRVVWEIERGPDEPLGGPDAHRVIMRLSATLTPILGGTAVSVDVLPAGGGDPAGPGALDRQQPALADMWRAIAGEQVDAVLTHRPFDMANIAPAIALVALARLPELSQPMEAAGRAATDPGFGQRR